MPSAEKTHILRLRGAGRRRGNLKVCGLSCKILLRLVLRLLGQRDPELPWVLSECRPGCAGHRTLRSYAAAERTNVYEGAIRRATVDGSNDSRWPAATPRAIAGR